MAKQSASMLLWNEPWFRKLPAPYKLAWKFLVDHANTCGIVFVDTEYWMFMLGIKDGMNWDKFFEAVGDKIHRVSATEIWIPQVINERCGAITWDCRAHRPVIDFLKRYGLTTDQRIHVVKLEPAETDLVEVESRHGKGINTLSIPYQYPIDRVSIPYAYPIDTLSRSENALSVTKPEPVNNTTKTTKNSKPKKPRVRKVSEGKMMPPTQEQVAEYCRARNNGIDPFEFYSFYQTNGWVQGKSKKPVKDWQAAVHYWERDPKRKEARERQASVVPIREQMAKAKEEQNKPEPRRAPLLGSASV